MRFGDCEIAPGEKRKYKIPVSPGADLDCLLICGERPGKTLSVTAGVHGCEYVGIEALRRLGQCLKPAELSGNVILIPTVNMSGFLSGCKQLVPEDGKNLNRVFPGNAEGTKAERIAAALERVLFPASDFLLDLHGGDVQEVLTPLVFCPIAGKPEVNETARRAAEQLSVPLRVHSVAKNGLYSWAVQRQIPALLLERGSAGRWTEQEVEADIEDILRIMNHLGIRNEAFEPAEQLELAETIYQTADMDGFWYPSLQAGQHVRKGEPLGVLESVDGGQKISLSAEFDGLVLYEMVALGVREGNMLIAYGRPEHSLSMEAGGRA